MSVLSGLTVDQWTSLLRTFSKFVAGALVTTGIISPANLDTLTTNSMTIGGALLVIVPIIWDMFSHSKTGIVKAAAALPEVKDIIATPSIADSIPSDKVRSERGR